MTGRLSRRADTERRSTLWQIAALDVRRHLTRSGASQLDCAATWASLAEEAREQADRHAAAAGDEGESYADVARALGLSRQSARTRYLRAA